MSTLPTRKEARVMVLFYGSKVPSSKSAPIVAARANGTLQTEQEFRDSLDWVSAFDAANDGFDNEPTDRIHKHRVEAIVNAALGDPE